MFGSPKDKPKSLQFFCESCGAEVPRDAKACPQCGKRFASVRCPACGFVGDEAAFTKGCPGCGYSAGKPPPSPKKAKSAVENRTAAAPLPFWIYFFAAAVFCGIFAALFFTV